MISVKQSSHHALVYKGSSVVFCGGRVKAKQIADALALKHNTYWENHKKDGTITKVYPTREPSKYVAFDFRRAEEIIMAKLSKILINPQYSFNDRK